MAVVPSVMLDLIELVSTRNEVPVFQPVSVSMVAGSALEVTGANGAGKSTLLRTVAGLHTQYDGSFQTEPLLYQGHRLALDELSHPLANLRWYADIADLTVADEQLVDLLDSVGMRAFALTPIGRLSQGQQRRVAMARWQLCTRLGNRRVWLLDEPVTALDVDAQHLLVALIQAHCAVGGVVIYATHTPLPIAGKQSLEVFTVGPQRGVELGRGRV